MTLDNITRSIAHLELLGIGSLRHRTFKSNLLKAMADLRITHPISEVTDLAELLNYDITGIPALVINGQVVFEKEVPSVDDLKVVLGSILKRPRKGFHPFRIVAPTDFSSASDNAVQYAVQLAETFKANLELVHIHQEVSSLASIPHISTAHPEMLQLKRDLLKQRVREIEKQNPTMGVEQQLLIGKVNDQLRTMCRNERSNLLVLGATGEGATRLDRIGSHASAIARKSDCPVLLIPEGVTFKPFKKVLFASKLLPGEESVWPVAVDLASQFNAEVHFVHIAENQVNGYHLGQAQDGAYPSEQGALFRLATVKARNVIEGLNQYAEEQQADLLVMATTHRNFLQDLFHRSSTHRMIFTTRIPLLVLHFSFPNAGQA